MIVSDEINVKATCIFPAQHITEMEDESSTALPDQTVHEAETTRSGDTGETTPTDLEAVGHLFYEVLTGKVTVEEACMSQELTRIIERLDVKNNIFLLHEQLSCGYTEDDGHIAHVPHRRTGGHLGTPHPSNV